MFRETNTDEGEIFRTGPGAHPVSYTKLKVKCRFVGAFRHWRLLKAYCILAPSFISRGAAHQQAWALSASEGRNYVYLNLASKFVIHERTRFFYVPQTWDMGQVFYFPSEGRLAENCFNRSGANPRSWVPEASMLTTRPPKPLLLYKG
jgi:hypothetical protein